MQLTAKLSQVLPMESGMGKNGEWKKQSFIVETEGQFPKKICFTSWGDKFNAAQWQPGLQLTVDFDIESREFNGRWYTDVKAWKIEPAEAPQHNEPLPMYDSPVHYSMPEPPPLPAYDDVPF